MLTKQIDEFQQVFHDRYPYLRLVVGGRSHHSDGDWGRDGYPAGTLRITDPFSAENTSPGLSVADLERNFKERFGVELHVCRRSGSSWIAITHTRNWSLDRQNYEGENLTKLFSNSKLFSDPKE